MFQIQPEYGKGGEYLALAEKMGLFFEILELSMERPVLPGAVEWYKNSKRATSIHGAFIDMNPVSGCAGIAEVSKKKFDESCELAKAVGAKNVVFHSSCYPNLRGKYLEGWADRSAEYYTELSERYGLKIFIENSFDLDAEPLRALMDRIKSDDVGVCLDIGHVNLSRRPIDDWFESLGSRIKYIHISDNTGYSDDHIALGQGTAEVKKASEYWRYLGDVPITLEVGDLNNIILSLEYINENGLFGM